MNWAQALSDAVSALRAQFDALFTGAAANSSAMLRYAAAVTDAANARKALNAAAKTVQAVPSVANMAAYAKALSDAAAARKKLSDVKPPSEIGRAHASSAFAVAAAYAAASASLVSFVRSGLSGTTVGERLSFVTQQLYRSITSAFLPAIEMGIAKLQQITAYFKNLSGEQQASIMRWTGVSVGMLGVMTLLPRLGAGLSTISKTLYGMAATNPFLLIAGGLVALLSRTEEGRTALSEIGHSMMEAFTAAAELLMSVLVPALDFLTEALSGPGGKVILLGTLFLAASVKIIGAIRSISAAAMTLGGPIGIALAAIGAVVAALTMANSGTKEFMGNVTNVLGEVRKGTTTKEQAKEQIRRNAEIQAEEEAEKASKGWGKYDPWRDTNEERVERRRKSRVEELTKAGEERLETGLKRLPGQGRSDLVQSRTGTEDARATLKRLEDSIIKSGANELAKQQLEELKDIKDELRKKPGGNRNDERENPPKGW